MIWCQENALVCKGSLFDSCFCQTGVNDGWGQTIKQFGVPFQKLQNMQMYHAAFSRQETPDESRPWVMRTLGIKTSIITCPDAFEKLLTVTEWCCNSDLTHPWTGPHRKWRHVILDFAIETSSTRPLHPVWTSVYCMVCCTRLLKQSLRSRTRM